MQNNGNEENTIEEIHGLEHKTKRLEHLRKRREYKHTQIWTTRFRVLARISLIVFLFWSLFKLMTLPHWYLNQGIFSLYPNKALKIDGIGLINPTQVLTSLKPVKLPNKPIYLIDTKPFEKAVEKLSPVRKAYIRRFWFPARFEVVIDEKTPIISVAPSPKASAIAVFVDDATIIGREYLPIDNEKFPTYKILTYDDFFKWSKRQVKYIAMLAKRLETYGGEDLVYLDIRNPENTYANLETIKIRIGELNSSVKDRIKRISSILPQIEDMKNKVEYIDLRWEDSTYIKLKGKESYQVD